MIEQAVIRVLSTNGGWMSRTEIEDALGIDRFGGCLMAGICNSLVSREVLEFSAEKITLYRLKKS